MHSNKGFQSCWSAVINEAARATYNYLVVNNACKKGASLDDLVKAWNRKERADEALRDAGREYKILHQSGTRLDNR